MVIVRTVVQLPSCNIGWYQVTYKHRVTKVTAPKHEIGAALW